MLQAKCSIPGEVTGFFSIDLILSDYDPGIDSAANRNKYQESSWRIEGGRSARNVTPHHNLSADCLEYVGVSTSHNPTVLHGLLQG
jgi:hypothetical protein